MGSHINNLQLNIDEGRVFATYSPVIETGFARSLVSASHIRKELADAQAADFFLYDPAISELVKTINENRFFSAIVGEKRDGAVIVDVTPDQMEAYVQILPPYGGSPVSLEKVKAAIAKERIIFGMNEKVIEKIRTDERGPMEYLIASGERPVSGIDAELVYLVSSAQERKPRCDDNGVCDLRDLGEIPCVAKGAPLMRRIPPVPGKNGKNVRGKVIEHLPCKDVVLPLHFPGTCVHPDDPDLLIAAVAGQPVFVNNGVMIDPVLTIKEVNLKTGHLLFDGSITISGDVRSGMIVRATGDITISGVIENATVESSGGSVNVAGGIIGTTGAASSCAVTAKENISCLFAEHATINAGGDVIINGDAVQSSVCSGGTVLVGVDEKRGKIVGGCVQARACIRAQVVGAHSGAVTQLYVGLNPMVIQRLKAVQAKIEEKIASKEELIRRREYFVAQELPAEKIAFTQNLIDKADIEIQELVSQKKRYQKQAGVVHPGAEIVVARRVHSGVMVNTGIMSIRIELDQEATIFRANCVEPIGREAA